MCRGIWKSLKILLVNYALFGSVVLINHVRPIKVNDLKTFFVYCIIATAVIYPVFLIINCAFVRSARKKVKNIVFRIIKKKYGEGN